MPIQFPKLDLSKGNSFITSDHRWRTTENVGNHVEFYFIFLLTENCAKNSGVSVVTTIMSVFTCETKLSKVNK